MKPRAGEALCFPTASVDGVIDERYLHSGEPVHGPTPKWIVGTWLLHTDGRARSGHAAAGRPYYAPS